MRIVVQVSKHITSSGARNQALNRIQISKYGCARALSNRHVRLSCFQLVSSFMSNVQCLIERVTGSGTFLYYRAVLGGVKLLGELYLAVLGSSCGANCCVFRKTLDVSRRRVSAVKRTSWLLVPHTKLDRLDDWYWFYSSGAGGRSLYRGGLTIWETRW